MDHLDLHLSPTRLLPHPSVMNLYLCLSKACFSQREVSRGSPLHSTLPEIHGMGLSAVCACLGPFEVTHHGGSGYRRSASHAAPPGSPRSRALQVPSRKQNELPEAIGQRPASPESSDAATPISPAKAGSPRRH